MNDRQIEISYKTKDDLRQIVRQNDTLAVIQRGERHKNRNRKKSLNCYELVSNDGQKFAVMYEVS